MIIADHCACKRVEWQWAYHGGLYGTAVCYDCRNALRYTNVPGFVDMIIRNKLTYMETPFAFLNAIGSTSAASRRAASSR